MRLIFNREAIAFSERLYRQTVVIPIDWQEMTLTPFGFFIPIHTSAFNFIKVLRGEISVDAFAKCGQLTFELVRIDHHGRVSVLNVNSAGGIQELPVTTTMWTTYGFHGVPVKASNAAYDYLLEGCKTMSAAIQRIESTSAEGFYKPIILTVDEIVKVLREKKLTKEIVFVSTEALSHYVKN